jgi:hypothetical protein
MRSKRPLAWWPEAAAQRVAIADWVYWQHLSVLTSDALAGSAAT